MAFSSALIQQLRDAVRDQEVVVDVLRQALVDKGLDDLAVNELIIKRTCAGPKRFRPKSREELQRDYSELEQRAARLEAQLIKAKSEAKASAVLAAEAKAEAAAAKAAGAVGAGNVEESPGGGRAPQRTNDAFFAAALSGTRAHASRGKGHGPGAGREAASVVEAPPRGELRGLPPPEPAEALEDHVSRLQVVVAELRGALREAELGAAEQAQELGRLRGAELEARRLADKAEDARCALP